MSKKFSPLRYPNARIDTDSDYLELRVVEYKPPGFDIGGEQGLNMGTSTDALQENIENPLGFIFLPIPENIQDSNSVTWGDDSINGLAALGVAAAGKMITNDNLFKGVAEGAKTAVGGIGAVLQDTGSRDAAASFFAAKAANVMGANTSIDGVMARSTGQIINPNMELLFKGITIRSFNFSFDNYLICFNELTLTFFF